MFKALISIYIVLFCSTVWAAPQINGYLSNHTVYRVVENDTLSKKDDDDCLKFENKVKLEIKYDQSFGPYSFSFFTSGEAYYDPYTPEAESDFVYTDGNFQSRLRDAYIDISHDSYDFDMRIGKQVVAWGNSDGMPITDIVTPLNLSEFIIPDWEDIRIAIPLVKLNYYLGDYVFEGIYIPKFYPNEMATEGSWQLKPSLEEFERKTDFFNGGIRVTEIYPDKSDEYEFGFKLSGFLFDTDFSVMFLQTYEDILTPVMPPSMQLDFDPDTPAIYTEITYNHVNMYGFTVSRPLSSFVVRSEAAFYKGKKFPSMKTLDVYSIVDGLELIDDIEAAGGMYEKDYLHYMIGADYSGLKGFVISGQFEQKYIFDFDRDEELRNMIPLQKLVVDFDENNAIDEVVKLGAKISSDAALLKETENSMTLIVQKGDEIQDTFFAQVVFMKNLTFHDYLIKLTIGYSFHEGVWLYFGYNMLEGDDDTAFGIFDENDNIFVKLKYSF